MVDHYDAKKEGTNMIRFATSTRGLLTRSLFSVDAPDPQSGRKEQVSTSLHRMRKSGDDRWKS